MNISLFILFYYPAYFWVFPTLFSLQGADQITTLPFLYSITRVFPYLWLSYLALRRLSLRFLSSLALLFFFYFLSNNALLSFSLLSLCLCAYTFCNLRTPHIFRHSHLKLFLFANVLVSTLQFFAIIPSNTLPRLYGCLGGPLISGLIFTVFYLTIIAYYSVIDSYLKHPLVLTSLLILIFSSGSLSSLIIAILGTLFLRFNNFVLRPLATLCNPRLLPRLILPKLNVSIMLYISVICLSILPLTSFVYLIFQKILALVSTITSSESVTTFSPGTFSTRINQAARIFEQLDLSDYSLLLGQTGLSHESEYLTILASTGLIGLFTFFLFLLSIPKSLPLNVLCAAALFFPSFSTFPCVLLSYSLYWLLRSHDILHEP